MIQKNSKKVGVNASKRASVHEESKVILYTTRKCSKCKRLKSWLRRNKIAFVTKSLDDTDIMTDLVMRNIFVLSAPALEVNGHVFLSNEIFLEDNRLNPEITQLLRGKKI